MGCGEGCGGVIDVSELLGRLPAEEWSTIAVRLSCFEAAGVDMTTVGMPFALATEGSMALRFAHVRLVSAAESEADCPTTREAKGDPN